MWWSWRTSKQVKGTRITANKGGVSASRKLGRRTTVSFGKRGARASFKIGPFRFGGKL